MQIFLKFFCFFLQIKDYMTENQRYIFPGQCKTEMPASANYFGHFAHTARVTNAREPSLLSGRFENAPRVFSKS
jgi:hypothetical protein